MALDPSKLSSAQSCASTEADEHWCRASSVSGASVKLSRASSAPPRRGGGGGGSLQGLGHLGASALTPRGCRSRAGSCASSRAASREGSPGAQQRARSALRETALGRFRAYLLRQEPNFARAWRRFLDPLQRGFVNHQDFCDIARRIGYTTSIRETWQELDAGGLGRATLGELDWHTAETLGRFHNALMVKYTTACKAASRLGLAGGRRLSREDFCARLLAKRLAATEPEAAAVFDMLSTTDTSSQPVVALADFVWLAAVAPQLPRSAMSRVAPGSLAKDVLSEAEPSDVCSVMSESIAEDDELFATGTVCSDDDYTISSMAGDGEDVYEKLYKEADLRRRRQQLLEAQAACQGGAPALPESRAAELYRRLHSDAGVRRLQREAAEEERIRELCPVKAAQHDPNAFARLVRPRQPTSPPCSSQEQPTPQMVQAAAARRERLYAEHRQRLLRQESRRQQAFMAEEAELQALQLRPRGVPRRANPEQLAQRLHDAEVERRRRKEEQARREKEEKERQEREQKLHVVPPPAGTFDRMHAQAALRQQQLQERKREQEVQEAIKIQAASVHKRHSVGQQDGRVFDRLHTSYNRHRRKWTSEEGEGEFEAAEATTPRYTEPDAEPTSTTPRTLSQQAPPAPAVLPHRGAGPPAPPTWRAAPARPEEPAEERIAKVLVSKAHQKATLLEETLAEVQARNQQLLEAGLRACEAWDEDPIRGATSGRRSRSAQGRRPPACTGGGAVAGPELPGRTQQIPVPSRSAALPTQTPKASCGGGARDGPGAPRGGEALPEPPRPPPQPQPPPQQPQPQPQPASSALVEFLRSVGKTETASLLEQQQRQR